MTFTKEQLKNLYPAEIHFDSVVNRSTIRNAPSWLTEQVINIYYEATGKKLNYQKVCSVCTFNIYKTVGKIYFEDLEQLKSEVEPETKPETKNTKTEKCQKSKKVKRQHQELEQESE